jgi:uncharacterized protein (DUF1919 family)
MQGFFVFKMIGRLWLRWNQYWSKQARNALFQGRRKKLHRTDFAIIANNCWGGEVYKYFDLPFNTPFIGLFLYPDCYLDLLEKWDSLDLQDIRIGHRSKYSEAVLSYPVGILRGDIEIHFLHYKSLEEADSKWKRRSTRIQSISEKGRLFVKFCDRDKANDAHFERFGKLDFPNKVSFSVNTKPYSFNRVTASDNTGKQADDGVKMFWYEMENGFNLYAWLNRKLFPGQNS